VRVLEGDEQGDVTQDGGEPDAAGGGRGAAALDEQASYEIAGDRGGEREDVRLTPGVKADAGCEQERVPQPHGGEAEGEERQRQEGEQEGRRGEEDSSTPGEVATDEHRRAQMRRRIHLVLLF